MRRWRAQWLTAASLSCRRASKLTSDLDLFLSYWGSPAIAYTIMSFEFPGEPAPGLFYRMGPSQRPAMTVDMFRLRRETRREPWPRRAGRGVPSARGPHFRTRGGTDDAHVLELHDALAPCRGGGGRPHRRPRHGPDPGPQ